MLFYLLAILSEVPFAISDATIPPTRNKKGTGNPLALPNGPPSKALIEIKRLGPNKVRVVLAEGWENVLPKKHGEDPGSLIIWDDDNLQATVVAFNTAIARGAGPQPPAWMNVAAGVPITAPALQAAILAHVQASRGGGGGVVGNALIAPNTIPQYKDVTGQLGFVGFDPFVLTHAVVPIGRNYIIADRRKNTNTTAVADPVMNPPVGLGVGVFN